MDAFIRTGYLYELAGLLYFAFYLMMMRGAANQRFSARSKAFTLIAAIVLVGSVPFGYATNRIAIVVMLLVVGLATWSTYADRSKPPVP